MSILAFGFAGLRLRYEQLSDSCLRQEYDMNRQTDVHILSSLDRFCMTTLQLNATPQHMPSRQQGASGPLKQRVLPTHLLLASLLF
jgi:hypothetical protein